MLKRFVALSALFVGLGGTAAQADFVVDPTGGTNLFSTLSTHDDETTHVANIGFSLNYFGTSSTAIDVSTNGNINFSANTAFSDVALPTSVARIAPLWDDLVMSSGGSQSITSKSSAGLYYAVTWNVGTFGSATNISQFQAVLFGGDVVLDNFQFHANDIAFAYQAVATPFRDNDATVGLDKGDSVHFSPLPGTTNGAVSNSLVNLLPTATGSFVLFRPNIDTGGYDASVQQASAGVPEPSTWLLSGIVAAGGLGYARRRRARAATNAQG